jgi:hypothetical protein
LRYDAFLAYAISIQISTQIVDVKATFDRYKDQSSNLISAETVLDLKLKTDVFLTHDWGIDELGRSNHDRVAVINKELKSLGFVTWFDSDRMTGDVVDQMISGIDNASVIIVFITQRYMNKLNGSDANDNCRKEFRYAAQRKSSTKMIPVVMESRMKDIRSNWSGVLQMELGNILYVDFSGDDDFQSAIQKLKAEILNRTNPLWVMRSSSPVPIMDIAIIPPPPAAIGDPDFKMIGELKSWFLGSLSSELLTEKYLSFTYGSFYKYNFLPTSKSTQSGKNFPPQRENNVDLSSFSALSLPMPVEIILFNFRQNHDVQLNLYELTERVNLKHRINLSIGEKLGEKKFLMLVNLLNLFEKNFDSKTLQKAILPAPHPNSTKDTEAPVSNIQLEVLGIFYQITLLNSRYLNSFMIRYSFQKPENHLIHCLIEFIFVNLQVTQDNNAYEKSVLAILVLNNFVTSQVLNFHQMSECTHVAFAILTKKFFHPTLSTAQNSAPSFNIGLLDNNQLNLVYHLFQLIDNVYGIALNYDRGFSSNLSQQPEQTVKKSTVPQAGSFEEYDDCLNKGKHYSDPIVLTKEEMTNIENYIHKKIINENGIPFILLVLKDLSEKENNTSLTFMRQGKDNDDETENLYSQVVNTESGADNSNTRNKLGIKLVGLYDGMIGFLGRFLRSQPDIIPKLDNDKNLNLLNCAEEIFSLLLRKKGGDNELSPYGVYHCLMILNSIFSGATHLSESSLNSGGDEDTSKQLLLKNVIQWMNKDNFLSYLLLLSSKKVRSSTYFALFVFNFVPSRFFLL